MPATTTTTTTTAAAEPHPDRHYPQWLERLGGPVRTVLEKLYARALDDGDAATLAALEGVASSGADGTTAAISVRQVARAFDMLGADADPADVLRVLLAPRRHNSRQHQAVAPAPPRGDAAEQRAPQHAMHEFTREGSGIVNAQEQQPASGSTPPADATSPPYRSERRGRCSPTTNNDEEAAPLPLSTPCCIWWMDGRYAADYYRHQQQQQQQQQHTDRGGGDPSAATTNDAGGGSSGVLWSRVMQGGCQAAAPRELELREWWYRTGWWLSSSSSSAYQYMHHGADAPPCADGERDRRQRVLEDLRRDNWRTVENRVRVRADPAAAREVLRRPSAAALVGSSSDDDDDVNFRVEVLRRDAELEYHLPLSHRLAAAAAAASHLEPRQGQQHQLLAEQATAVRERLEAWQAVEGDGGEFSTVPAHDHDDDGTELACGASAFAAAVLCVVADAVPGADGADATDEEEWEPADGFDFGGVDDTDSTQLGACRDPPESGNDDDAESFSDWPSEDSVDAVECNHPTAATDNDDVVTTADDAGATSTLAMWRIPLPSLVEPQDFRRAFAVNKLPSSVARGGMEESLFRRRKPQAWLLDHFAGEIVSFQAAADASFPVNAPPARRYSVAALLTIEKDVADATRLTLLFGNNGGRQSTKAVTLLFRSALDRNTFYAHAQAMRPAARVFAPHLCHPDSAAVVTSCVIDGIGPNSVVLPGAAAADEAGSASVFAKIKASFKAKQPTTTVGDIHLSGECRVNASTFLAEPVLVRVVTANATDFPATSMKALVGGLVRTIAVAGGGIDDGLVAVAVHNAAAGGSLPEDLLGRVNAVTPATKGCPFVLVASQRQESTMLIVLARARHLPKIAAVSGTSVPLTVPSTIATTTSTGFGGVAIALSVYETRLVFATCQLVPRAGRAALRQEMLRAFFAGIESHPATSPAHADHTYLFGELNACLDPDLISCDDAHAMLDMMLADGDGDGDASLADYDELIVNTDGGGGGEHGGGAAEPVLALKEAAPVTFPPTFRPGPASKTAPGYPARVFASSHTAIADGGAKCVSYRADCIADHDDGNSGRHMLVSARFRVACARPAASLGNGDHAVEVPSMFVLTDLAVAGTAVPFASIQASGTCIESTATAAGATLGDELVLTPATTIAAALAASTIRVIVTAPSIQTAAYAVLPFTMQDVAGESGGPSSCDSRAFEVPLVSGGVHVGVLSGALCNMWA